VLVAPEAVRVSEPVLLWLNVRNVSPDPISMLVDGIGNRSFNPVVRDAGGTAVWHQPWGRYPGDPGKHLILVAGDSTYDGVMWDRRRYDGTEATPGRYRIEAYLLGSRGDTIAVAGKAAVVELLAR
jgi:hypothetical protein